MESHRRLWHRLVSRLRGRNASNHFSANSTRNQRHIQGPSTSGVQGRYTYYVGDEAGPQSVWERDRNMWYPFLERNFFFSEYPAFTPKAISQVTPRCLRDMDAQHILMGHGSFDDFFSDCCLENHLHRFGALPREPDIQLQPITLNQPSNQEPTTSTTSGSSNNINSCGNDNSDTDSDTTVSDITPFYNSVAHTAFDQYPMFPEPPPYSELPDDPPPPYTEFSDPYSNQTQDSMSGQAGTHMFECQDILW